MFDLNHTTEISCNVGGDYLFNGDGSHTHRPPCPTPPTARYRPADPTNPNWNGGRWNYRCDTHLAWLDQHIDWEISPLTSTGKEK